MDFAVLVKVVPAVEQIRFDPGRKTLIRTGVQSFLNPNDSRAVRIAVLLRRPGERVTVISMGLPEAERQLRETFAFGADRVVLVTDPALAGSDTLVTGRVLCRALDRVGHDLVLAGERSIDSDTGQVGPEVAALLGVPVVTSVRSLTRAPDRDNLEAVAETGSGWNRFRLSPPAVVTVNERILRKAPKPTPSESARSIEMTVESLGVRELGLAVESVGLEGSPTLVRAVENEEPDRRPRIFEEGEVDVRVDGAALAVEQLLRSPTVRPGPLPRLSAPLAPEREVLVLVSGSSGTTDPSSLGVISELRRWGSHVWPSVVWIGRTPNASERTVVARSGAARGYHIPVDGLHIGSRTAARAMDQLLDSQPSLAGAVVPADSFGREVGGQLAARRGLGLTGDAVGLSADATGNLAWKKPAFGGGLVATIRSRARPSLATVRTGAFVPSEDAHATATSVEELPGVIQDREPELVESRTERDPSWGDLGTARVVLIAGMGLGGPENLPALRSTLEAWGAALGGTRRVIDAGWLPGGQQVGLTGTSVAADMGVLVGVSGAGNHLVGLRRTRVLVAINPDRTAPVFERVDVGIVGAWAEVLPRLTSRLATLARSRAVAPA
jgi:electron transfer flavoprotein alpha subunit